MGRRRKLQLGSMGVFLKLILLGDGAVGKTTLVRSFMDQTFQSDYLMTVGIDISVKEVSLKNGKRIKLTISDVAGQTRFMQFRSVFFNGANLAFLCFDVTRLDSLENLEREWLPQLIPTLSDPKFKVLLVANKIDLEEQRKVTSTDIRLVLKRFQKKFPMLNWVGYIETSALKKHNVQEAFGQITEQYFETQEKKIV
ncbi:MAG: GTPase Der [Candidatus Heimdallarchaeota archaeon LC_3]|nr:MAG: GTPase Der [Candidatus Heimdallarchaeota archaeon LC_3]